MSADACSALRAAARVVVRLTPDDGICQTNVNRRKCEV
jgi:hypothetical protein